MINTRNMTAKDAYTTRLNEIKDQLELLNRKIKAHQVKTKNNTNWAHVGDLTHLLAQLEDANNSI